MSRLPAGVDVHERGDLVQLQRELARVPGVTVLIHDQECAAEQRRKRKRGLVETPSTRVMINEQMLLCAATESTMDLETRSTTDRVSAGRGLFLVLSLGVELTGLEPVTPTLPAQNGPSL